MSSLSGVTIYIFSDDFWTAEPVFGEFHILDDTEDTIHYAGYGSQYRNVQFWVLDITTYSTLESAFKQGNTVTLVDWQGNSTSVKIRSLKADPMTDIKRPPNYAVYRCRARLQSV